MFVFGSVWDYLLYNTITSNPLGLLYVIALVGYTALIMCVLSDAANKVKRLKKMQKQQILYYSINHNLYCIRAYSNCINREANYCHSIINRYGASVSEPLY